MDDVAVREAIRQFILSSCLQDDVGTDLRDDMPLRTSGILDSFATMGLVDFVARQFAVELNVYDTSIERFNRIADMAAVVSQKRGGREAMLPTSAER